MILTASSPSIEAFNNWICYEKEKSVIMEKDFSEMITTPDETNLLIARYKKISLKEYKNQLSDDIRQDELKKLKEKFGIEQKDESDERNKVLQHYEKVSKQFENNEIIQKIKNINKLFDNPNKSK